MPTTTTRRHVPPGSRDRPPPPPRRAFTLADGGNRILVMLLGVGIILTIFAGRLVQLQAVQGESLASAALDQRLRTVTIPAGRGAILDADGQPFAITVDARNVTVDQTLISDPLVVAEQLAPLLGTQADVLAPRLAGDRRFVYLAKGITPEVWGRISDLRLPGIFSEPASRRIYPAGDLAANVVGFVGAEGGGLGGIEYAYDEQLAGAAGELTYERGPGGNVIPSTSNSTTEATQGASIRLTINRDIQYVAQRALAKKVEEAQADSGTIVVMEARTGRVLALATVPTFDPNNAGSEPPEVLGNRALSNVFEPGSTAKLMSIAAVVNEGKANPYSPITVPSSLKRGDKVFHDSSPHGTLQLTLAGVMARSSNMGTILASERIGGKKLYRYLKRFGIGEPSGLGFPGESSGYVPPYDAWSPTSFPTIAFGQGLSVNAVQSASVFATIANDGVRVTPTLVDSIVMPDGTVQPQPAPQTRRVVSVTTATQVRAMLESVVGVGGTAPQAAIPGYRVAGKTGTAQEYNETCHCYSGVVASFIGMAPADAPELVVAVSIMNPRVGRYGGELGAPVFKKVMTNALQAMKVPPTGATSPRLPLTFGG